MSSKRGKSSVTLPDREKPGGRELVTLALAAIPMSGQEQRIRPIWRKLKRERVTKLSPLILQLNQQMIIFQSPSKIYLHSTREKAMIICLIDFAEN